MADLAVEMKASIALLAGDRSWSETRQRWLERAARVAGISYRSAYSLFYQQGHEPRASTVEKIRCAIAAQAKQEAIASDELFHLKSRIVALEAALVADRENPSG